MGLTGDEVLDIAVVLSVDDTLVSAAISSLGSDMDSDRETRIRTQLTRWETSGGKFVRIKAKESNKGVETDSSEAKTDIQRALATLLRMPMAYAAMGMGTVQIG